MKTADFLLGDLIKPLTEKLLKKGLIEKWFFIRYEDPKFHLRVRFKVSSIDDIGEIINEFSTKSAIFIEENLIWKVQIDTYQREVERYGKTTMELSETLFFYDSEMIVQLLDVIDDSEQGEELRWLFGLKAIDVFLNDFKQSEDFKLILMELLKINFFEEFNANRSLKKQLEKKFRLNEEKIIEFINLEQQSIHEFTSLISNIKEKSDHSSSTVSDIINLIEPERLNSFLASHIHMMMNRLFRSKNRLHELVIYYFLFRHYKILIGRKKYMGQLVTQQMKS